MLARYQLLITSLANDNVICCENFLVSDSALLIVLFVTKQVLVRGVRSVFFLVANYIKLIGTDKVDHIFVLNCEDGKRLRNIMLVRNVDISRMLLVLKG